jgi:hypothetical protein
MVGCCRLVVAAGLVALAFVGSHRTADAACAADPPGLEIPQHESRSLELEPRGWRCVLESSGTTVADIPLGWLPKDLQSVWSEAAGP